MQPDSQKRTTGVVVPAVAWLIGAFICGGLLSACDGRAPIGSTASSSTEAQPAATAGTPSTAPVDTPEIRQALLARWNAVADPAGTSFSFHWTAFEQFPHPTYKGGSVEAYGQFAAVLLAFFQRGDDFDFLAKNHLFALHLVYIFPSGQNGLDTTFETLARKFSAPDAYGNIPADMRLALQAVVDLIDAAPGSPTAQDPIAQPAGPGPGTVDPVSYEVMCRHYCATLAATDIYACVNRGGGPTGCANAAPATDQCYDLRCVPKLVSTGLCLSQCDVLSGQYDALCASGDGPAPLCTGAATDSDRTCRDGCNATSSP